MKDEIKQLSEKIETLKESIQTEEATKNAFIMPFIRILGYDVFNPMEVVPELDCDINKKKGEKIDYAILRDGNPVILIECKHWEQKLSLHETQLKRYFTSSSAKFGILTNGIQYLFYTDLEKENLMDDKPFLEIDITNIKDSQIEELKKFHKSNFDIDNILSSASDLKYTQQIRNIFATEVVNPSQEIATFFAKKVYDGKVTSKIQEQFQAFVKRAINSYISEQISNRLKTALDNEDKENSENIKEEIPKDEKSIITTQEELDGFAIVKAIICNIVDVKRVVYRDALSYFSILLDDNRRKPICRLYFNGKSKKYIAFIDKDKNEEKHEIQSLDDIYKFENELRETVKMFE